MLSSIALRFQDKSTQVQQWVTLQQWSDILNTYSNEKKYVELNITLHLA